MRWALVGIIVGSTVLADMLQSLEMKRYGEISDFRPGRLGRLLASLAHRKYLIMAIFFMAISFFAFMHLLTIADLGFAVPVTASSLVVETLLAKLILKEHVDPLRWIGACLVAGGVLLLAPS